jgi:hypothetical protein
MTSISRQVTTDRDTPLPHRMTSIKWPEPVDARLRLLVNLAAAELGRPTSAAEILAGLVVRTPLDGKRAARVAQALNLSSLKAIDEQNAEHASECQPRRGRPRRSTSEGAERSAT